MSPTIGEPVPAPRVTRRRPRDPDAMAAVDQLLVIEPGMAIPVTGWEPEADDSVEDTARKFGNRVQGYAERDHELKVHASFDKESETLYLSLAEVVTASTAVAGPQAHAQQSGSEAS